jgi:hypothetical protein
MSAVSAATLAAALLFAGFHLPVPALTTGGTPRVLGIGYHLLLLPAVAALPAPDWVRAAGFAWMLIDAVLNGAALHGLPEQTGDALRQGVHVLSSLWVVGAGWSGGPGLAAASTCLALAFLTRFCLSARETPVGDWIKHVNAALNVVWMLAVALTLWN